MKGRAGLAEFTDEAARDEAVLRIASKVSYELDQTIDYPKRFIGHVRLRLNDGRVIEEYRDHPRGGPEEPMTREELEAKFRGNAALCLPADRIAEVIKEINGLAGLPQLASLTRALSG